MGQCCGRIEPEPDPDPDPWSQVKEKFEMNENSIMMTLRETESAKELHDYLWEGLGDEKAILKTWKNNPGSWLKEDYRPIATGQYRGKPFVQWEFECSEGGNAAKSNFLRYLENQDDYHFEPTPKAMVPWYVPTSVALDDLKYEWWEAEYEQ